MNNYVSKITEPLNEASKSLENAESVKKSLSKGIQHLIKWKVQPSRQSSSWAKSINDAITEIEEMFDSDSNNKNFKNIVYADSFDNEAFELGKSSAKSDYDKALKNGSKSIDKNEVDKIKKEIDKLPFINAYSLDNFRNRDKTHQYMINTAENGAEKYVIYKEASELSMYDLLERRKNNF